LHIDFGLEMFNYYQGNDPYTSFNPYPYSYSYNQYNEVPVVTFKPPEPVEFVPPPPPPQEPKVCKDITREIATV